MPAGSLLQLALRYLTSAGVAPPSRQKSALLAVADADVEITGSAAIPIGGSATLTTDIAATSSGAIPIGGSATGTVDVQGTASGKIPIGGSATGTATPDALSTLSDPFDGTNGTNVAGPLYTNFAFTGGTAKYLNSKARLQLVGNGAVIASTGFQTLKNYDARNSILRFGLDMASFTTNDEVLVYFTDPSNADPVSVQFIRTGAGAGTVSIRTRNPGETILASAAFNPDADTQFKVECDTATYGKVDAVRVYKSNGAGGWTLLTSYSTQFNGNLVAVKLTVFARQTAAVATTVTADFDNLNAFDATTSRNIPLGGSATGQVGVAGVASAAIPVGGSATGAVGVAASASGAIPVGGAASGQVGVASTSTQPIPIGGSATGTVGSGAISADSNRAVPIGGSATGAVGVAAAAASPIPLGGSATGTVAGGAVAHRYWRVLITTWSGAFFPGVGDIQFRSVPGGANVVAGGTALSDSDFSGGSVAANAFDGSAATVWSAASGGANHWIGYRWGVGVTVDVQELRWTERSDGGGWPSAASVQWSDDGITWTTRWSYTDAVAFSASESRIYTDPNVLTRLADSNLKIPIGGSATGTVVDATPLWARTDLGPDVAQTFPTTLFIGIGPADGLPRNNSVVTVNPPSKVYDGVDVRYTQVTVNPNGFGGTNGEAVQRQAGTGAPSPIPLILTFSPMIRGFKVTARGVDFSTGTMKAKGDLGNLLQTVVIDPVIGQTFNLDVTVEIQRAAAEIRTIELLSDAIDWISFNDMYMTYDHVGTGGWDETDLDVGLHAWAEADAAPATGWS